MPDPIEPPTPPSRAALAAVLAQAGEPECPLLADHPVGDAGGLVEEVARIIASDSSESPESFVGIAKDVICAMAARLDLVGNNGSAFILRRETYQ